MNHEFKSKRRSKRMLNELYLTGRFGEFIELSLENLRFWRERIGDESMSVEMLLQDLAFGYKRLGDLRKAVDCQDEALKIFEKKYGRQNAGYSSRLVIVGNSFRLLGDHEAAESKYVAALDILTALLPENETCWTGVLVNFAMLRIEQRRFNEAEELLIRAISFSSQEKGLSCTMVLGCLAKTYYEKGDKQESEKWIRDAIHVHRTNFNRCDEIFAGDLVLLGKLCEESENLECAIESYEEAFDLLTHCRPRPKSQLEECERLLAKVSKEKK